MCALGLPPHRHTRPKPPYCKHKHIWNLNQYPKHTQSSLAYNTMSNKRKIPVIEYLKDRIYLGAFDYVPDDTPSVVHFIIDDELIYNSFHHDFGPLNIAHLYRFAVILHELLAEEQNEGKAVILYSSTDPRARANAACVLSCYMVLIQNWAPHFALAPIAQADPPLMPFRDAGYSQADYILTIQDVIYGLWRAKENNLLDLKSFNLEEYELYERVDQGDFNEIPPHFIAFASPQQNNYDSPLSHSFTQVIEYFKYSNVRLVVRLNSHLYNKNEFESQGIKHIDMIFDDGTCPSMTFVRAFVGAVEGVIAEKGKVAVHCKAGLGRTGCLIGAHLIYTYGFTASEAIAYMRFLRPGMVVGPQQHWLYLHQNEFREWKYTMTVSRIPDPALHGYSPLVPKDSAAATTAPIVKRRSDLGTVQPKTPERAILGEINDSNNTLPVPTPCQPRKSPSPRRVSADAGSEGIDRNISRRKYLPLEGSSNNSDDEDCDSSDGLTAHSRSPRRNLTENLTHTQQLLVGKKLRSISNPSPQKAIRPVRSNTDSHSPGGAVSNGRSTSRSLSNSGVRKASVKRKVAA